MKILLIGAGAIGGALAALIHNAGYDISILEINQAARDEINEKGIHLYGVKGEFREMIKAYGSVDEIDEKFDIVIIATKYSALKAVAQSSLKFLKDDSLVIGMLTGICMEGLAEIVGKKRTVGCMIGFGATKHSVTDIEMTSLGEMYIGMPDGYHPPILDELNKIYNCVLPTQISDEIIRRQYSKLIINSCINATAAITGETLGVMLDDKRAQDLFLTIAREAMHVAKAMNIKVPKYGKLLYYNLLMLMDNKPYNAICKAIVLLVGKTKYKDVKPSTLQSLERGEKTEIDIFNGYIVRMGEKYNVPTPVNAKITEMIREIERGERKITMDNLAEFYK